MLRMSPILLCLLAIATDAHARGDDQSALRAELSRGRGSWIEVSDDHKSCEQVDTTPWDAIQRDAAAADTDVQEIRTKLDDRKPQGRLDKVVISATDHGQWRTHTFYTEMDLCVTQLGKGDVRDLENGLTFPAGEAVDVFKAIHRRAKCWDLQGALNCGVDNPEPSDCPSLQPCAQPVYVFRDGVLVGFSASYGAADWNKLLAATTQKYGRPRLKASVFGSMEARLSNWNMGQGNVLSFAHFLGSDANGNAIARPFAISYGPNDSPDSERQLDKQSRDPPSRQMGAGHENPEWDK